MRKKIFLAIFLTLLCAMICTAILSVGISYNKYMTRLTEDLNIELRFLSSVTENFDELGKLTLNGRRITLIDQNGKVLFDSIADQSSLENHMDRQEVRQAIERGSGFASRDSESIGQKYIYQAILLSNGLILRLSTPANTLTHFVLSILWPLLISIVVVAFFAFFLSSFIARKITDPINNLDLDNPDKIEGYPELSPLLIRIAHQQSVIQYQLTQAQRKADEFALITSNMQEGLVVISNVAKILSINESTRSLFGNDSISEGESILHLSRSVDFSSIIERTLNGNAVDEKLEQNNKVLEVIANPVYNAEHESAGAVLIFIDISEKEKREQMRREFTANVSHELKTPLTVISGFAELMQMGLVSDKDVKDYARDIYNESQRLMNLVHDIIRLSQLDESKEKSFEDVRLSEIVQSTISILKQKSDERNIAVEFNCENESLIKGNPALLSELVYNIVENAIRYNKDNGRVDISLHSDKNGSYLVVKDTGKGIPPEDRDRVFERFYRVDKDRSRESGGTGLGLSIVKHVCEYHRAMIDLESVVEKGTTISIAFPNNKE